MKKITITSLKNADLNGVFHEDEIKQSLVELGYDESIDWIDYALGHALDDCAEIGGIRTIDVVAGFASGKIKAFAGLTDAGDDVRIKVETA